MLLGMQSTGHQELLSGCLPPAPHPAAQIRQKAKAGEQLPVGSMKIPMVDLPLGATEDRVCGTIDIEKALTEGG
jgi:Mg-chelatase subunit ChlI